MKKRLLALILVFVIAVSFTCKAEDVIYTADSNIYNTLREISFTDVAYKPVDHWSSTAIYVMASIGAIKGYMTSPVKNHEAMAVLFRCAGLETTAEKMKASVADFKAQNPGVYNDIDSWADGYLRLAVDKKLITAMDFLSTMEIEYLSNPNPLFRKEANATRCDLARWMVTVFGVEIAAQENLIIDFKDYESIKEEDRLYLETAVNCGILKGADGFLNPYSGLTREEMAQMFYNVYPLWAKAGGYEVISDTVSDITVDTVKNADGTKLENTKTITVGSKKLKTRITYNLQGEVVDHTIYSYNEYVDFPVVRDKNLPADSSVLNIGDTITLMLKANKVVCGFQANVTVTGDGVLDTSGYESSQVYEGKLYCYDKDDKTVVIEDKNGDYIEIPLFPQAEFFAREKEVTKEDINSMYADTQIFVFTVRKSGTETDRGYRVQIL